MNTVDTQNSASNAAQFDYLNSLKNNTQPDPFIKTNGILVFLSDLGLKDVAVGTMKGVARSIDSKLQIEDLTHQITPFDIEEAAYQLNSTARFWPAGTVFVIVVDPGVGSARKSIALQSQSGHFFICPDNGIVSGVTESLGVAEIREINHSQHVLKIIENSNTFHGRDLYANVGAQLAAGQLRLNQLGKEIFAKDIVSLPEKPVKVIGKNILGHVVKIDHPFGNLWTNIPATTLQELGIECDQTLAVHLHREHEILFCEEVPFVKSFAFRAKGDPLLYLNSNACLALALNQRNFAETHQILDKRPLTIEIIAR